MFPVRNLLATYFFLLLLSITITIVIFLVENLLATGEGGQTFEPAKFKLLLHHRKLELQASGQVLTMLMFLMIMMMIIIMVMLIMMMMMKLLLHHIGSLNCKLVDRY